MIVNSRVNRFLTRLTKVVSKNTPDVPGRNGFARYLQSIDFDLNALYKKYPVNPEDKPLVERHLQYLSRYYKSFQHKKANIDGTRLTEYESAIYNAILQNVEINEIMSALNYPRFEDFIESITDEELKALLFELRLKSFD